MPEKNLYPTEFGRTARAALLADLMFALTVGADRAASIDYVEQETR